jgi:hypothetical protein
MNISIQRADWKHRRDQSDDLHTIVEISLSSQRERQVHHGSAGILVPFPSDAVTQKAI